MIKIESLINSIYSAVLSANDTLVSKNLDLLLEYFEDSDENQKLRASLQKALDFSSNISEDDLTHKKRLAKAVSYIKDAAKIVESNSSSTQLNLSSKLKPKTVTIQYPTVTASGPELQDVQVPLIAISPISLTEISEVKITTQLEVVEDDEEIFVSFPSNISKKKSRSKDNFTTVEIIINKATTPDGLKKIIEGYEKALRAQIPG